MRGGYFDDPIVFEVWRRNPHVNGEDRAFKLVALIHQPEGDNWSEELALRHGLRRSLPAPVHGDRYLVREQGAHRWMAFAVDRAGEDIVLRPDVTKG